MSARVVAFAAAGVALAMLAGLLDIAQGQGDVPLGDVWSALFNRGESLNDALVLDIRLPRAAAGIVAGFALAGAAIILQAITRNPLAEPATLGLTAGGALAVTLVAAYATLAPGAPTIAVAFVGVAVGTALIGTMAAAGGGGVRLILAGMAVGLALAAGTAAVRLTKETETSGLFLWGAGSLLQNGWGPLTAGALIAAPALLATLLLTRSLDVAVLGEHTARALGQRAGLVQLASVTLAAVLTAVAVGLVGPIAFVGILAGGLARAARPKGHLQALLVALPWGAAILLAADVAGRVITGLDTETPAGVVCALIGAPVLVIVAKRLRGEVGQQLDTRASGARWRPRAALLAALLLPVAIIASLCLGEIDIGPGEVVKSIFGSGSPLGEIALESRAPRLAVALLGGACLAASGTVLQAAVRNPFAGPELAGVVGGASVGAFLVLLVYPDAPTLVLPFASFAGALLAMAAVLALAGGTSPTRLALIGLAVTAACSAVTMLMLLNAQPAAATAITWLIGSTYATSWADFRMLLVPAVILLPLVFLAVRRLDVLMLDDDLSRSLGLHTSRTRALLLAAGAALGAAAVAVCGAIAFVGLLAPHAARLLAGGNHRRSLPMAMVLGALLLGLADTVGRTVLAPTEIPSGLIVSLIGAPYLAVLLWRSRTA
ncbi:iron ABC transporter permease [Solirubrobacter phytolaccae]|uniref:Iron ABC transporter permease n=1 Tax=Solirubrobacter phytolaccae TaxID=1404360 RepID=A0A9X3S9Q3_9ACTN|nr:iron ABC transporter permease [Solirubrobacter phytolaccae]MDA0181731.1 iron ABC transporter permease [Solirubrobacter phytolaccae]